MNYLECSITTSFTISHAEQTLKEICENIDRELNSNKTDLDKKELDAIHRHLSNAINCIGEAKEVIFYSQQ